MFVHNYSVINDGGLPLGNFHLRITLYLFHALLLFLEQIKLSQTWINLFVLSVLIQ